jgi:predicted metalloendopeptidase
MCDLLPSGRLFDKDGNVKLWWSQVDVDQFKEKAKCFVEQYSNYTVVEVKRNVS